MKDAFRFCFTERIYNVRCITRPSDITHGAVSSYM